MNIVRAAIYLGNVDEDSRDRPFIWGDIVSKSPVDAAGKKVQNPASFLVYNAGELARPGRVLKGLFKANPGTPLLEYIHDGTEILEALGLDDESELPEVTCLERRKPGEALTPESLRAQSVRESRRASRTTQISEVPETIAV